MFNTLERQYDQMMSRRATLNGQGSSLLTFAGVIQTIMVAPLIALATNPQARTLLQTNPNIRIIEALLGLGFGAYITTILLALLALRETKWVPAPVVTSKKKPEEWRAEFDAINANPTGSLIISMYEMQLMTGITAHQATNNRKYDLLMAGFVTLAAGIVLSALSGYLLLLGSI